MNTQFSNRVLRFPKVFQWESLYILNHSSKHTEEKLWDNCQWIEQGETLQVLTFSLGMFRRLQKVSIYSPVSALYYVPDVVYGQGFALLPKGTEIPHDAGNIMYKDFIGFLNQWREKLFKVNLECGHYYDVEQRQEGFNNEVLTQSLEGLRNFSKWEIIGLNHELVRGITHYQPELRMQLSSLLNEGSDYPAMGYQAKQDLHRAMGAVHSEPNSIAPIIPELTPEQNESMCVLRALDTCQWAYGMYEQAMTDPSANQSHREWTAQVCFEAIDLLRVAIDWYESLSSEKQYRARASKGFHIAQLQKWYESKDVPYRDARDFVNDYGHSMDCIGAAVDSDECLKKEWGRINEVVKATYPLKHPDVEALPYPDFLVHAEGLPFTSQTVEALDAHQNPGSQIYVPTPSSTWPKESSMKTEQVENQPVPVAPETINTQRANSREKLGLYLPEIDAIRIKWELPERFTEDQLEDKFLARAVHCMTERMKNRNKDEFRKLQPYTVAA